MEKKIRLRAFDQLLTRIIGKLQRTRKNLKNQEKLNNLRRLYMEKKSRLRAFARTRAKNIQLVSNWEKIQFIKLDITNWRIGKIKFR